MGPPQIIRAHFHPSERATSCWLRQEIMKVLLFVPFISTTGGCESNSAACDEGPEPGAGGSVITGIAGAVAAPAEMPAADHAAGLEIPAFSRAFAIFCC